MADGFIEHLINLARLPYDDLPNKALKLAQLSLLDWMACGIGGVGEPLAHKLRDLAVSEGGNPVASVFGAGKVPARMAALVNGATSHALDYDDTHFAHVGHLSVGIFPAALAVGEEIDASVDDVLAAFLVGAEAAIRIGLQLGRAHYDLGFHQTATAGAFGATLAAGRLLKLDQTQMRNAIGLCSTRASGLKSQFGTMGKPYNAGIAASNGVECAKLAALGMTSAQDGLTGAQGFLPTHTPHPGAAETKPNFLFETNKYKLHACCHGTHAMIEALATHKGRLADIRAVTVRTNTRWLKVCDIKSPRSGLEVKFSYCWLAGMTLRGDSTHDEGLFTDQIAADSALAAFGARVIVEPDKNLTDLQVAGSVTFKDGTEIPIQHDLTSPIPLAILTNKLRAKAQALIGDASNAVWAFADPKHKSARQIGDTIQNAPNYSFTC